MVWKIVDRMKGGAVAEGAVVVDEAMVSVIKADFERYPTKRAVLLKALHLVQAKEGFVSDQAMREVAGLLEISPAEVLDTLSFYDMYSRQKRGRHLIGVCVSLSCELCGCEKILGQLKKTFGIGPGETTEDGSYTVVPMECIGTCEYAPAILVDEQEYKIDDVEQLEEIIAKATGGNGI